MFRIDCRTLHIRCLVLLALALATAVHSSPHRTIDQSDLTNRFDLRDASWGDGTIHELQGNWQFAWQQLVSPDAADQYQKWRPMPVPGAWNDTSNPVPFAAKGFASYRLILLLPDNLRQVHLAMPDMASAYRLWANGELKTGNGQIGKSRESERPGYLPRTISLTPDSGRLELLIHTSNYHYQWGGIWYAPQLTDDTGLYAIRELPVVKASIYSALLLGTGVLALLLFLSRPQDRKVLFFALFCLVIGFRRLLIDERIFYLTGWGDWHSLQFLENATIYLSLPLFIGYFYHCFPQDTHRHLVSAGWALSIPFMITALATPVDFYTQMNVPFQLLCVAVIPYILWCYGKAFKARRKGARMFGFSLLIFVICVANDVLTYNYLINTPNMMHLGALAFVMFQLSALIRRYLQNFRTIEIMSRKLTEQNRELVQLDAFKDEFLATTSHELRTPLHGISGLVRSMDRKGSNLNPEQHDTLQLISATTERLNHLVNDILDYSSLKHGKLELHQHPVHLPPLVKSVQSTLSTLIDPDKVRFECNIDSNAQWVFADEQRLEQILFNLLGNAVKHTPKGTICVDAHRMEDAVHIKITDTGSGIPAHALENLLQPFEHYVNPKSTQAKGSGLGLTITQKLVELHAGSLSIDSKPDMGTCVEFTLPNAEAQNRSANETRPDSYRQKLTTKQNLTVARGNQNLPDFSLPANESALVFYADDEKLNRELVETLLKNAGYEIRTFGNGEDLLSEMENFLPDLVLLDLMMPGLSGIETCRELRQQHTSRELPVMMLTARHQTADILAALAAGANDYLTKPYHEAELLARMHSQLSIRRFWQSTVENARLEDALKEQTRLHRLLRETNRQLENTLDCAKEALVMASLEGTLLFSNQAAVARLGKSGATSLSQLLEPDSYQRLVNALHQNLSQFRLALRFANIEHEVSVKISLYQESTPGFLVMLLEDDLQDNNQESMLATLTDELAQSRKQIAKIEAVIFQATRKPSGQSIGDEQAFESASADHDLPAKELVVKTLRTTLLNWERYTHQSKADLAEKSKCWRVYLDGTTAKTRTLDKYLSVKTLPAKPRWRTVIKTANYVIDNCELSDSDRNELEQLIDALDNAFA